MPNFPEASVQGFRDRLWYEGLGLARTGAPGHLGARHAGDRRQQLLVVVVGEGGVEVLVHPRLQNYFRVPAMLHIQHT